MNFGGGSNYPFVKLTDVELANQKGVSKPLNQGYPVTQPAPSYKYQTDFQVNGYYNQSPPMYNAPTTYNMDNTYYTPSADYYQQPQNNAPAYQPSYQNYNTGPQANTVSNNFQYAPPMHPAQNNGYPKQQSAPIKTKPVVRKNYYYQKINSTIPIERSAIIGRQEMDTVEFDDYFEKHADKFFSPEIDEIFLYYTQSYLVGIQAFYRDSWGREDRETYKGSLHMSKSSQNRDYFWTSLKLEFDDFIKEIYTEGEDFITYLKIVSYKGKAIEVGTRTKKTEENLVPTMTKCIGFGGSHGSFMSSLYFYCA